MDYETLIENLVFWSKAFHVNPQVRYALEKAATAITDLLARAEAAEARERGLQEAIVFITRRAEKAEEIASDLCDDFTDFVTSGIHNASPYCANICPECVDGRGWCNMDRKACRGFYPKSAKKEE